MMVIPRESRKKARRVTAAALPSIRARQVFSVRERDEL